MRDTYDQISDWLLERALRDADLSETLSDLAERLNDMGVAIDRLRFGRMLLHPVIGFIDVTWTKGVPGTTWGVVPRKAVVPEDVRNSPFGEMMLKDIDQMRVRLKDPEAARKYEVLQALADEGLTDYVAFQRKFDLTQTVHPDFPERALGTIMALATRRFSGFSDNEIAGLQRLATPLAVCVRVATETFLARELLETYLGRISGRYVLNGQVSRGDCRTIDCALLYSDMRGSTELARKLTPENYVAALNAYFDCTARAVLDHGGEVLKYIGDGILAIFPFESQKRPKTVMCEAALSAAREAFERADLVNAQRRETSQPGFQFGVALHVGQVLYGNIGTEKRLDFTATGQAVAIASRCETLTRDLDASIVATQAFTELVSEDGQELGAHTLRGIDETHCLFGFSTLAR